MLITYNINSVLCYITLHCTILPTCRTCYRFDSLRFESSKHIRNSNSNSNSNRHRNRHRNSNSKRREFRVFETGKRCGVLPRRNRGLLAGVLNMCIYIYIQ